MKKVDSQIIKSVYSLLNRNSVKEFVVTPIIMFPFIILLYEFVLTYCGYAEFKYKYLIYIGIAVFYLVFLGILKYFVNKGNVRENRIHKIISEFRCNKKEYLSFNDLKKIDTRLKKNIIENIIKKNPNTFRKCKQDNSQDVLQFLEFKKYMDDIFKEDIGFLLSYMRENIDFKIRLKISNSITGENIKSWDYKLEGFKMDIDTIFDCVKGIDNVEFNCDVLRKYNGKDEIISIGIWHYKNSIFREEILLILKTIRKNIKYRISFGDLLELDKNYTEEYLFHLCKYDPNEISILNENGVKYLAYKLLYI